MEWFLAFVLGAAALVYICAPLWAGTSGVAGVTSHESWHTVEQLEIDRELGKIDEAEYEELKPELPQVAPEFSLEALIFGTRRQKRLDVALESEVLIARARHKK